MIKYYNCLLIGLMLVCTSYGQHEKLKNNFILPLTIEPALSGNFAEPRYRHFHSGVDFRTYQDGRNVVVVADGSVSRILVSPWGYGLGLYVNHSEGYTSVYGHCSKFSPEIQKFVADIQYQKQSYSIDTIIDGDKFPVKKGQIIAYSGNTGHSEGPHLHFEIRETHSEMPVNIVYSIYNFKDTKPPEINYLVFYPLSDVSFINGKNEKLKLRVSKSGNKYVCDETMPLVCGLIGVGVAYLDRMDNSSNRFGAKTVSLKLDNEIIYMSTIEKISFDNQKAKNSMFDFEYLLKDKLHVHKLFVEKENKLKFYDLTVNDGMFAIESGHSANLNLEVKDYNDNSSFLSFSLNADANNYNTVEHEDYFINSDSSFLFADRSFRFDAPVGLLFHDYYCKIVKSGKNNYSDIYIIGEDFIAVNNDFTISFFLDEKLLLIKDKLYVSREHDGDFTFLKPELNGNYISAKSSYFGKFYLWADTTSPKITPINIYKGGNISSRKNISFKIEDDLSGIHDYSIFINDQWVLTQYDPRSKLISYVFDERFVKSETYNIKVVVTDNLKNTQTLEIHNLK